MIDNIVFCTYIRYNGILSPYSLVLVKAAFGQPSLFMLLFVSKTLKKTIPNICQDFYLYFLGVL